MITRKQAGLEDNFSIKDDNPLASDSGETEAKPTRWPWRVDQGVIVADVAWGDFPTTPVAFCSNEKRHVERIPLPAGPVSRANACLIAAAPEMLAMLKRYRNETPLGNQPHMIAHEADALIAKAEGR